VPLNIKSLARRFARPDTSVAAGILVSRLAGLDPGYMYGIIGSAIMTGMVSILLLKKFRIKSFTGEPIIIPVKKFHWGNVAGGLLFGLGWAITGACPGPLFAQIGGGFAIVIFTLLSAIAGTWVYGLLRTKLPH